ncbi:MAG: hypothetical protein BWY82_02163 [Verrucomicrobia bacterium ADurb.Bin474]|nr:MAG: hypothetical protein BWY82_02163 [Verrucomicrobia bacterium ADurb.Bin474]
MSIIRQTAVFPLVGLTPVYIPDLHPLGLPGTNRRKLQTHPRQPSFIAFWLGVFCPQPKSTQRIHGAAQGFARADDITRWARQVTIGVELLVSDCVLPTFDLEEWNPFVFVADVLPESNSKSIRIRHDLFESFP